MINDDLESTDEISTSTEQSLGQLFAQNISEVTVSLITIVNLLRQQPGFDDKKFLEDVQTLLTEATEAPSHTKIVLSHFLENSQLED